MKADQRLVFRQRFGCRLKALRIAKGLTKPALADALGWTVQNVDGIERGDWGTDASNLQTIADVLGVSVAELLEEPEHAA